MKAFWLLFWAIALLVIIFFISRGVSNGEYETRDIRGWKVNINRQLWTEEAEITQNAIALLDLKLKNIKNALPQQHHSFLKSVTIWIEKDSPDFTGMVYHPSAKWLSEHGYNPAKAKAIEIANINNFIQRTKTQPWHVLHELAHAYHDRILGKDFPPIIEAYNRAASQGLYRQVLRNTGDRLWKAYALNSHSEYFAELTEAYFGENDFYPFTRQELKQYDPIGYRAIEKAWGIESE